MESLRGRSVSSVGLSSRLMQTLYRDKVFIVKCIVVLSIVIVLTYFVLLTIISDDNRSVLQVRNFSVFDNTNNSHRTRQILLWNSFFNDPWFNMRDSGHFDKCSKYTNCVLTRSKNLNRTTNFDVILFHGNELDSDDLPRKRDPRQRYVFVNLESPINRPITDAYLEDYFNMTMTYRLDSDIPWPYEIVRSIETGEMVAPLRHNAWIEPSYDSLESKQNFGVEGKSKLAAWLVSNCRTPGKRELLVSELKRYMEVDIIGGCGAHKCPRSKNCLAEIVQPNYFFYFSFENSLCEDYVTEKFYEALRYNVIPVVYGGANYSLFAPPHSYINALDFESPKALANFLIALSRNREEYLSYFWWKRYYTVDSARHWTLCKLCEILNEPQPPKTYSPLSDWYTKDMCPIQDHLNGHEFATKDLVLRRKKIS